MTDRRAGLLAMLAARRTFSQVNRLAEDLIDEVCRLDTLLAERRAYPVPLTVPGRARSRRATHEIAA